MAIESQQDHVATGTAELPLDGVGGGGKVRGPGLAQNVDRPIFGHSKIANRIPGAPSSTRGPHYTASAGFNLDHNRIHVAGLSLRFSGQVREIRRIGMACKVNVARPI